jgi:hypothetical protein
MLCHSSSRSCRSASNRRCQIPLLAQRSNRLNTVFQGPKSLGRSRHGAPVRLHHSTASTKLRSSRPRRPPRISPPSAALILCHRCSSNCKRTIVDPSWRTLARRWKARSSERPRKVGSPARPAGRGARGQSPRQKPRPTRNGRPRTFHGPSGTFTERLRARARARSQFRDTPSSTRRLHLARRRAPSPSPRRHSFFGFEEPRGRRRCLLFTACRRSKTARRIEPAAADGSSPDAAQSTWA